MASTPRSTTVTQYLTRTSQRAGMRANLVSRQGSEYQAIEDRAWQWIEEHHPDVMTQQSTVANVDYVRDIIARAVSELHISAPAIRKSVADALRSRLIGAGSIDGLMNDPTITEITITGTRVRVLQVNPDTHESTWNVVPLFSQPSEVIELADFLCTRAGARYQPVKPLQTIIWPGNGARINLVHHSVTGNNGPAITIRKRNKAANLTLADLVDTGMLNMEMADLLILLARSKSNMVIAGATNTGKTTVLRAIAQAAFGRYERIITIEDIDELQLVDMFPDVVSLVAREKTDEDSAEVAVTSHDLFVNALRMTPERLVVGEVRGVESKDVLEAGVTEPGGLMFTVHIKNPVYLTARFYWMLLAAGMHMPYDVVEHQVKSALNIIVQITRWMDDSGRVIRRITAITEITEEGDLRPLWLWTGEDWEQVNALSDARQREIRQNLNLMRTEAEAEDEEALP